MAWQPTWHKQNAPKSKGGSQPRFKDLGSKTCKHRPGRENTSNITQIRKVYTYFCCSTWNGLHAPLLLPCRSPLARLSLSSEAWGPELESHPWKLQLCILSVLKSRWFSPLVAMLSSVQIVLPAESGTHWYQKKTGPVSYHSVWNVWTVSCLPPFAAALIKMACVSPFAKKKKKLFPFKIQCTKWCSFSGYVDCLLIQKQVVKCSATEYVKVFSLSICFCREERAAFWLEMFG